MSDEKQETIEDIVAEMREYESTPPPRDAWLDLADRIEAAWKAERERGAEAAQICGEIGEMIGREATTEKSSRVGNSNAVREVAQEMLNTSMQAVTAERINGWAMRLAAACEQSVTDCNHLGNAAKIREAYEFAEEFLRDYGTDWKLHNKLCDMLKSALAEPLRNCDLYSVGEALRKYGFPTKIKPWGEKEWLDFCEWLVSEVEGETKGE